jgi:hypothetical protein
VKRIAFYVFAALVAFALFRSALAVDHQVVAWKTDRTVALHRVATERLDHAATLNRLRIAETALRARDSIRAMQTRRRLAAIPSLPVPDTCVAVVALRDSVIVDLQVDNQSQRDFIVFQAQSYEGVIQRMAKTDSVLVDLVETAPLPRKSFFARILPRPSAGIGVVVNGSGLHAGLTLQLGWRF